MKGNKKKILTDRFAVTPLLFVLSMFLTAPFINTVPLVYAATSVANRYDKVSSSEPSAVASHLIGFDYTNFIVPVGSINLQFCGNSPIIGDSCVAPTGFDVSSALLNEQSGEVGFTIATGATANELTLTRPALLPSVGSSSYQLNNVVNPALEGTYYLRIQTFTSVDATGISVQEGGVAVSVNEGLGVQTTVPPHLTFCVGVTIINFDCSSASGYLADFGELSQSQTKAATSQMAAATNAEFGYNIFATGTTFTSGNNIIPAMQSPTQSLLGVSQFGINLRANTQPAYGIEAVGPGTAAVTPNYSVPNRFMYIPGDSVASATKSQDWRKYTVTYIVNINSDQPPGNYATTITYICLANF